MYFIAFTAEHGNIGTFPDYESAREAIDSLILEDPYNWHIEQHNDDDDLKLDW